MKLVWRFFQLIFLTLILFFLFVRSSVWMATSLEFSPWLAVVGGALVTTGFMALLISLVYRWFSGRIGTFKALKRRAIVSLLLVASFALYSAVYLPETNAKGKEVASEFHNLHPALRIGVKTVLLGDRKMLVTDASRLPGDYDAMGLRRHKNSMHYPQADGFVHAVDIRTADRSEVRNTILILVFRAMGYCTLRHIGTADHLHVEL